MNQPRLGCSHMARFYYWPELHLQPGCLLISRPMGCNLYTLVRSKYGQSESAKMFLQRRHGLLADLESQFMVRLEVFPCLRKYFTHGDTFHHKR